jgi:alpha-mannosidase
MNNHWHTNYRAEQEGPTVFRYLLVPHGPYNQHSVVRSGLAAGQPLVVAAARGELPPAPRFYVSDGNAVVSAWKPSEDGRAWIVRLFGAAGTAVQTELKWADPAPSAVWLSDGSEQPRSRLTGPIDVPAYGIVTLRADLPPAP